MPSHLPWLQWVCPHHPVLWYESNVECVGVPCAGMLGVECVGLLGVLYNV